MRARPSLGTASLLVTVALAALCLAGGPAQGADPRLQVTPAAAFEGNFGLEVSVVPCAVSADLELTSPLATVSGLHEACESILVHDIDIDPSGAQLTAGRRVEIGDGFVVPMGADLEVTLDPGVSPFVWVEDDRPAGEAGYRARYHARFDGLTLGADQRLDNFAGYSDSDGRPLFRVLVKRNPQDTEDRLLLAARQNDGSEATTPWGEELLLPSGWNRIEIQWSSGAGTGFLLVSLNSGPYVGLADLDNEQVGAVDRVRWGVVGSDDGAAVVAAESMELDSFRSWRQ